MYGELPQTGQEDLRRLARPGGVAVGSVAQALEGLGGGVVADVDDDGLDGLAGGEGEGAAGGGVVAAGGAVPLAVE